MTTLTGSTPMGHKVSGPPFSLALFGACTQLGTLGYTWSRFTSAGPCLTALLTCLEDPTAADTWGLFLVGYAAYVLLQWLLSIRTVWSSGTSDCSIVDRLWTVVPPICVWIWWAVALLRGGGGDLRRLTLMALLSTLWGARLTWNFWRKGGFSGGEDHRWATVRSWYPGWRWEVFNLVFVCCFQQCTILAMVVPAVAAMQSETPLGILDATATLLYLLLCLCEAVADEQMYQYQTEKYRRQGAKEEAGPYARGFIETGLWAYSRHPNYFCEVSLWWSFYLFAVAATGRWANWTIWGAVFLTGLFVPPGASCDVSEKLSSSKYPAYREYQQRVNRFVPWFPRGGQSSRAKDKVQ